MIIQVNFISLGQSVEVFLVLNLLPNIFPLILSLMSLTNLTNLLHFYIFTQSLINMFNRTQSWGISLETSLLETSIK